MGNFGVRLCWTKFSGFSRFLSPLGCYELWIFRSTLGLISLYGRRRLQNCARVQLEVVLQKAAGKMSNFYIFKIFRVVLGFGGCRFSSLTRHSNVNLFCGCGGGGRAERRDGKFTGKFSVLRSSVARFGFWGKSAEKKTWKNKEIQLIVWLSTRLDDWNCPISVNFLFLETLASIIHI